jgi:hypothetical protein
MDAHQIAFFAPDRPVENGTVFIRPPCAPVIKPNVPVVFEDEWGFPHWGVALSAVIPTAVRRPWPHVLIRVVGAVVPVPARDVEVWLPGVAAPEAAS